MFVTFDALITCPCRLLEACAEAQAPWYNKAPLYYMALVVLLFCELCKKILLWHTCSQIFGAKHS
jgi:hypothetical protein